MPSGALMVSIVVVVMAPGLAVVHGSARAKLDRSGVATEINAMMFDTFLAALILAGLVNGVVIGAIVLLGNRERRAGLALGGLILVAAAAGGLILFYGDLSPDEAGPVLAVELALTLAAGPLLLIGVAGLTGQLLPRRIVLIGLLLAILFTALADWLFRLDPVVPAVLAQIGFTIASCHLYTQRQPVTDRRTRRFRQDRIALALLLAMFALHAVQLAKMALPRAEAMAWAVPGMLAVIMALAAGALIASAARRVELGVAPANTPEATDQAAIDALIAKHLAAPDLTREKLATLSGIPLLELRALYARDGGIAAAIRRMRVAKAADELTDPAEQRTSIDAIALGCGFRSRSAFYEAFRRERGVNPGEFRKQAGTRLS